MNTTANTPLGKAADAALQAPVVVRTPNQWRHCHKPHALHATTGPG